MSTSDRHFLRYGRPFRQLPGPTPWSRGRPANGPGRRRHPLPEDRRPSRRRGPIRAPMPNSTTQLEGVHPCRQNRFGASPSWSPGLPARWRSRWPSALAEDNEVVGAARFKDEAARQRLETAGVRCVPIDLATGDVGGLPADADYVINFAVSKSNDWELDLRANSGGLAWLMEHHRDATRLRPLLDHRGLQAPRPPRVRRGGRAGGQPRSVAVPADLQHLQDRRRGHRPLGGGPVRPSHHRGPAVGARTATGAGGRPSTSR